MNLIEFFLGKDQRFGEINRIFLSLQTPGNTWIIVKPSKEVNRDYPDLNCWLVRADHEAVVVIETHAIIGHVAILQHQSGTFGISTQTISAVGLGTSLCLLKSPAPYLFLMAPNDTTNSAEGNEDGGSGGNDADSQAPLSKEEESIASIICNLIPKYQDQSGGASMETDEPAGAGGQSSNPTNKPAPLPKEPQLSTEFTVKQAQIEKSKIEDAAAKKKIGRPPQVFPHPLPLKRKTHNIGLKNVLSLSSSNWMTSVG
ncbi:hypothetical protein MJO29_003165 [Puccinia striiformis f. sp. tritici]|nr:hypothetical protein MJO29_003165 [Puccinia striiformis f. sp. tritici]